MKGTENKAIKQQATLNSHSKLDANHIKKEKEMCVLYDLLCHGCKLIIWNCNDTAAFLCRVSGEYLYLLGQIAYENTNVYMHSWFSS